MVEINDEKEDHHMDSPNLLHMGLSKQTLETLGITLGKKTVNNVENVEHQGITYVISTNFFVKLPQLDFNNLWCNFTNFFSFSFCSCCTRAN